MGSEAQPFRSIVETQARELLEVVQGLSSQVPAVAAVAEAVVSALQGGNKILCAGTAGSAADALHMAEELVGRYKANRRSLPAISLAADVTALTCIGNDFGFDKIFSRQVESLGAAGDVLVLFSTSGGSGNLLAAARAAREKKVLVVGFLGRDGGALAPLCDLTWIVPSPTGARIQELHTWAMHGVLECVEAAFPA